MAEKRGGEGKVWRIKAPTFVYQRVTIEVGLSMAEYRACYTAGA